MTLSKEIPKTSASNIIKYFMGDDTPYAIIYILGQLFDEIQLVYMMIAYAAYDPHINTPQYAGRHGHIFIVQYLIHNRVHVYSFLDDALPWAAYGGHLHLVKYFVEDCKLNIHTNDEKALRWAIRSQQVRIINYLLKKGANLSTLNENKWSKYGYNPRFIRYLHKIGLNI